MITPWRTCWYANLERVGYMGGAWRTARLSHRRAMDRGCCVGKFAIPANGTGDISSSSGAAPGSGAVLAGCVYVPPYTYSDCPTPWTSSTGSRQRSSPCYCSCSGDIPPGWFYLCPCPSSASTDASPGETPPCEVSITQGTGLMPLGAWDRRFRGDVRALRSCRVDYYFLAVLG